MEYWNCRCDCNQAFRDEWNSVLDNPWKVDIPSNE